MNRKIVLLGVVAHLCAAIFSAGFYHYDEHFQILEFAGLKLGLNETTDLAWEYPEQIRPALQPAIAYALIKTCHVLHLRSPFAQALILRLLSAVLALIGVTCLIKVFWHEIKSDILKKWLVLLSLFLWFMPYLHVRFSSENWSSSVFGIGLALLLLAKTKPDVGGMTRVKMLVIGSIFGLAFILRYQAGLMLVGLLLWLVIVKKESGAVLLALVFGVTFSVLLGLVVDRWFYEEWTLTAWNYFKINLWENKAADFGVAPWWYYFREMAIKALPPFGLPIIVATAFFCFYNPRHVLTWIALPFIIVHAMVDHKELRFLFPLLNILPVVAILAAQGMSESPRFDKIKNLLPDLNKKILFALLVVLNMALLIFVCFKPADSRIYFYQYIYENYPDAAALLFIEINPYERGNLPVNFYKHGKLKFVNLNHEQEIVDFAGKAQETVLFAAKRFDPASEHENRDGLKLRKVFQTIPTWIMRFDFNHWLRKRTWTLYECSPKTWRAF